MRWVIMPLAVAGLVGSAALGLAAPLALPHQGQAAAALTLIRQGCGHGFQRGADAKLDKWSKWHGRCVARPPKAGAQMSTAPGASATRQLNQQELGRVQASAPAQAH